MNRYVITLARWLAKKSVKAQWKAKGRKEKNGEIDKASNVYFTEHEKELIKQALEHPIAIEYRHKDQMGRKTMITEFRKGRWVKSISPEDLQKIFEDYLEEYPEDRVINPNNEE